MNKKNITILIVFVLTVLLVVVFIYESYETRIPVYCTSEVLKTLRENIAKDVNKSKSNLLVDRVCGLVNHKKICYFHVIVQFLIANRNLCLFYIRNDFTTAQVGSLAMQKIFTKILSSEVNDISPELAILAGQRSLSSLFAFNRGGDIVNCFEALMEFLNDEISGIQLLGTPSSYKIIEKLQFVCPHCKNASVIETQHWMLSVDFGNNLEHCIKNTCLKRINEIKYKMFRCKKCNVYDLGANIKLDTYFSEHLILMNNRLGIVDKKGVYNEGKMKFARKLQIKDGDYILYAIVLVHKKETTKHGNVLCLRGSEWYFINDEHVEKVDLDSFKDAESKCYMFLYRLMNYTQ